MKMRKCIRCFVVAILAVFLVGLRQGIIAADLGIIKGRVTVGNEQQPLAGVDVSASNPKDWTDYLFGHCLATTDSLGQFLITHVPVGVARIQCLTYLPTPPLQLVEVKIDSVSEIHISYAPYVDGGEYEYGFDVGVKEAQQEWDLQAVTVYYDPGLTFTAKKYTYFDTLTGLPRTFVESFTIPWDKGLMEGHNSKLDELIETNGLPNYSRKPWLTELMNLKSYVERLENEVKIDTVRRYGQSSVSHDFQTAISFGHKGLKIRRCHAIDHIPNADKAAPQSEERIIAWGPPN
ncbi:MAG: carboxypeptidase regulatory-like domain-containing protein, partial [candidate division Zixibacteria bacterium]|nr:carboxypeptidase regulatory-like domain-containing protein [candidate division Zixibacteria bacterium]